MKNLGFVSLVGAGPGHPDYLTIKGARVLTAAQAIVYDALISEEFLAMFPRDAEVHYVGKRAGRHSVTQDEIISLLLDAARRGKRVVRLKGGDPGLFSRGGEEILALQQAGIAFEIVPGVSSMMAGAAMAGFSITVRGLSNRVVVFDGHALRHQDFDFRPLLAHQGTTVVLMGSREIARLAKGLMGVGAESDLPIALVESATFPDQHVSVSTLAEAAQDRLVPVTDGPGIIYVGRAVARAQASLSSTQVAA
jgi:uroporphyrin-III C-methyltransferase